MKHLSLNVIVSWLFLFYGLNIHAQTYEGPEAEKVVPRAASVLMGSQSDVPTFVVMDEDHLIPVHEFERWEQQTFDYEEGTSFVTTKTVKGKNGMTHQFRKQFYHGIPIDHALSVIHSRAGMVTYFNGDIHNEILLPITPNIQKDAAIQTALLHLDIDPVDWEQKYSSANKKSTESPDRESIKQTLVVFPYKGEYFLAWKIHILGRHFNAFKAIYVNALNGNILNIADVKRSCNTIEANTTWRAAVPIQADIVGSNFILHNDCAPRDIRTQNMDTDPNSDFTTPGTTITWNSTDNHTIAGYTAHFSVTQAFDYFNSTHQHVGLGGTSGTVNVVVGDFDGAFFNPETNELEFGLGADNANVNDDFTTLDICGHEYTHGVMELAGGITGIGHETNSLHEGIADIFGNEVQTFFDGGLPDWSHGDETAGNSVRFINNPNNDIHTVSSGGSPDTYMGTFWSGTSSHVDGGVVRFWFFLLSEGGSGVNDNGTLYNVQGIGRAAAAEILYEAIASGSFGANPNYTTARTATRQTAINEFGLCSNERVQVVNAWAAVGIGTAVGPDISISSLTAGTGNNIPASGSFTVNFNLYTSSNSPGNVSTYVGFFLRPYCTISGLSSAFDLAVGGLVCGGTNNVSGTISLPPGTVPGGYTLIAKADIFNWVSETNEWNNVYCTNINVTGSPLPDLVPKFPSVSPASVQPGNSVSAFTQLHNDGTAYAGYTYMAYYLSTNSTYSSNDVYLGNKYFSGLNPGSSTSGSKPLTIPATTAPGNYYIIFRADNYGWRTESNENNNVTAKAITVTSPPGGLPDLVINNVNPGTSGPSFVNPGQNITVTYTLANQQSGTNAGQSTTRIYFSTDNTVSSGDIQLHTANNQLPGSKSTNVQIPFSAAPQFSYLLVVADYYDFVTESFENNNVGEGYVIVNGFGPSSRTVNGSASYVSSENGESGIKAATLFGEKSYDISIFPNPARDQFTLMYPIQHEETVTINIYDVTGKNLGKHTLEASEQTGQWQYDASQLTSGVYHIYWQTGRETKLVKLIVE